MSAQMIDTLVAASGNPVAALALKATLLMVAALLLIRVARGASASVRHLLAASTFGVLLLLPLAAEVVPEQAIAVAPAPMTLSARQAATASPATSTQPEEVTASVPVASDEPSRLPRLGLRDVALGVYLLGAAGFLTSLLAGIGRLQRMRRDAEVSIAGTRLANDAARREGMPAGIEVVISIELAVPVTFGWSQPVILLPAEAVHWQPGELQRAIRHELEHIARGDWAMHILARAALALYWPHPFAWALWRRLRLEAERACDDAVILSQGQAEPYAEQLVTLARRLNGRGSVPALSMATRSTLGQRVEAILDGGLSRAPRSRATALLAVAAGIAFALTVAPLKVVFAAATIMDAAPAALLDDDEDDDKGDDDDESPEMMLLAASERGDLDEIRRLLDSGVKAGAILRGDGTPLIAAARAGRLDAIEMLLDAGADVNRGVQGDGNALIMAAKEGHLDAVRFLLDRGADIDAGVPGDGNALIMAAGAGHLDVVRFLVDKGANIEKVVPGDENPLIHASEGGQAAVARYLLGKGADVNARVWADMGNKGRGEWRTALLMARRNRHQDVVRILLDAGARE